MSDSTVPARLSIRAGGETPRSRWRLHALLRDLRAGWQLPAHRSEAVTSAIDIRDLQGRRVLQVSQAQAPFHVNLQPGTYNVSIVTGEQRRLYTVVLEPGTCLELLVGGRPGEPGA